MARDSLTLGKCLLTRSAGPLRGHQAVEAEDLVETWLTWYPSLHVYFTTLIHAVGNTGRGLDVTFHPNLPGFTQLGQPSPAQPGSCPEIWSLA